MRNSVRPLLSVALFVVSAFSAQAQITNVTADQQTPTQGVGHDYIHLLSETVDPSSGVLSLRITVPTPNGRGLTIPFAFAYDSNGVSYPFSSGQGTTGFVYWMSDKGLLTQGGWSYSLPVLSFGDESTDDRFGNTCFWTHDYVFQDPAGGRHALQLATEEDLNAGTGACSHQAKINVLSGGDDFYSATTSGLGGGGRVAGRDGTLYDFSVAALSGSSGISTTQHVPTAVEDRNGNKIIISPLGSTSGFTLTDTLGRQEISASGFGHTGDTVSVSGIVNPFTITWATISVNYTVGVLIDPSSPSCPGSGFPPNKGTRSVIRSIQLPNGQHYNFTYDSDDASIAQPFGLLSQITYPTGASVKYSWELNHISTYETFSGVDINGHPFSCDDGYDTPAVVTRTVSFDGINPALIQNFSYSTQPAPSTSVPSWTSKQTKVSTSDKTAQGGTFETDYSYVPIRIAYPPDDFGIASSVPVESVITNKDFNSAILQTVTKLWQDQYLLTDETTQLGTGSTAPTSSVHYSYLPAAQGFQLQEQDEYDFGAGAKGALLRKTITNYASFPSTPIYPSAPSIFNRPCQVITYDGSGTNRVAETDYFYDGSASTTPCSTPTAQTLPGTGSYSNHDETLYGTAASVARGNLTTVVKQCFQGSLSCASGNATTTITYDETGQELTSKDANGNTTQYSYADNFDSPPSTNTNAYATQITRPTTNGVAHIQKFKYAYSDGQLIQSTDENNQVTSYFYADPLRRITEVDYPDRGKTTTAYNDAPYNSSTPSPSVTMTRAMNSTTNITSLAAFDGLGHTVRSVLTSDPDCASGDRTDTTYDGLGRVHTVSNPYCSTTDHTYGIINYAYDVLGRTASVTEQDGSVVSTSYSGNCTTATDEASKSRKSCTDALGRLTTVNEDPAGLNYLTTYTYDALNNLTGVVQSGLGQRTFVYDSLSHLTSAANPESGTVTYAYDPNGNLTSKTALAPNQTGTATVTTTYSYDALNRLTQKSYSDTSPVYANGTPTVRYRYDLASVTLLNTYNIANSIGRLSWSAPIDQNSSPLAMDAFSYDPLGRMKQFWQETPANRGVKDQVLCYDYDLIGNNVDFFIAANQATPQGVIEQLTYNGVGRLTTFFENVTAAPAFSSTMISGITYNALGQKTSATFSNGLTQYWLYNKRGLVTNMAAGTGCSAGTCTTTKYGYTLAYAPNGNVTSANDTVNSNWSYSYDALNRLVCANLVSNGTCPTTGTPTYSYTYDPFGNRLRQTGPITFNATFTGNNNRIDGYCYDAAGNLLDASPCPTGSNPVHAFKYDAENRLVTTSLLGANYIYDAQGRRVEKTTSATLEDYIYDKDGNIVSNWITNSPSYAEYFANGWHFMTEYVNAAHNAETEYFQHSDWLGTERMRSDMNGNIYETCTSLPFGDGMNCVGPVDASPMHFTGKERDSESGLDNFGARYNSSSMGRFMTPDEPLIGQDATMPQSWNLYSYVRNNPINNTDPTGNACVSENGGSEHDDDSGGQTCAQAHDPKNNNRPSAVVTASDPDALPHNFVTIASDINRRNVMNNTLKMFGGSAVIGLTGGAACYYLCPTATVTSIGVGTSGEVITGLYGGVTRAALAAAANSGGETVTVITSLDSAPAAMQGLSTATGAGAEGLATAAQPAGQTLTAQIPKLLVNLLEKAGLAFPSTTSMGQAGGAMAQEIRFAPEAIQFVAKFFH